MEINRLGLEVQRGAEVIEIARVGPLWRLAALNRSSSKRPGGASAWVGAGDGMFLLGTSRMDRDASGRLGARTPQTWCCLYRSLDELRLSTPFSVIRCPSDLRIEDRFWWGKTELVGHF